MANEYDLTTAFEEIENELISSMMRNMARHRAEETEEGIQWSMWQAEQLRALEKYRRNNQKHYGAEFTRLNRQIEELIRQSRKTGGMKQEIRILQAIRKGFKIQGQNQTPAHRAMSAAFFRLNERKLNALVEATTHDMQKAETAVLRMANDKYRKIIYNAQAYANTGAGTYEKAVDMATKDFLSAGLNCIEYANGARHRISDYAEMAIRTASKRAYLQGEGEKRQEWGISTVIINKRRGACPLCAPFVGKVMIDDVWSGGKQSDGKYPLLSSAIAAGLYHPNCKDSHTTYFPGISTAEDTWTKEELKKVGADYLIERKQANAKRQAERFGRLAKYSLDSENKRMYGARAEQWKKIAGEDKNGIIGEKNISGVPEVHTIGRIDRAIYSCITEDIVTDEVIITDERVQHIIERRGKEFYEEYFKYFSEVINDPDYIFPDKQNTALVCKRIDVGEKNINIALRLVTSNDPRGYKNSIITAVGESDKRFAQRLRNNKALYKKSP